MVSALDAMLAPPDMVAGSWEAKAGVLVEVSTHASAAGLVQAAGGLANVLDTDLLGFTSVPDLYSPLANDVEERALELVLEGCMDRFFEASRHVRRGARWRAFAAHPAAVVDRLAPWADLIVLDRNLYSAKPGWRLLDKLLAATRTPLLLWGGGGVETAFEDVALLWDATPQSGRALTAGLPFVMKSAHFTVLHGGGGFRSALEEKLRSLGFSGARTFDTMPAGLMSERQFDLLIAGACFRVLWPPSAYRRCRLYGSRATHVLLAA